jgi:hypothetical protein
MNIFINKLPLIGDAVTLDIVVHVMPSADFCSFKIPLSGLPTVSAAS